MKPSIRNLLFLFAGFFVIKSLLALFTEPLGAFSDDYTYLKIAQWIYQEHSILAYGYLSHFPPLYSFFLSFAYVFQDMSVVFFVMKIMNALVSTLTIIPVFLIAKDFLSERDSIIIAALAGLIGSHFLFPNYILSENLFFPLVAFTIFFQYKAFTTGKPSLAMLSGIFLGLALLTRNLGYALLPLMGLLLCVYYSRINLRTVISHYLSCFIVWLPYVIYTLSLPSSVMGSYVSEASSLSGLISHFDLAYAGGILTLIDWFVNYLGYTLLAIGVFFGVYYLSGIASKKEYTLSVLYALVTTALFITIFLAASHSSIVLNYDDAPSLFDFHTYRPIGRYMDSLLPFVFLLGFIVYGRRVASRRTVLFSALLSSLILFWSVLLTISPLFPVNNISITYVGLTQFGLEYLFTGDISPAVHFHWVVFLFLSVILFSLPGIMFLFRKSRWVVPVIFTLFLFNLAVAYGIHVWDVQTYWLDNDQTRMGLWIDENIPAEASIRIDATYCTLRGKQNLDAALCARDSYRSNMVTYWLRNPLVLDGSADYLLTMDTLPYKLEHQSGDFKLYAL